jgi:hypothetical protein
MADFPTGNPNEVDLLLSFLAYLRETAISRLDGLDEAQARWRPDGKLISLAGIVNHLTHVEWRWTDGAFLGRETSRSEDEFSPGADVTVPELIAAYRARGDRTDSLIRGALSLNAPCVHPRAEGLDLRWVVIHLIEETGRHSGHADATREMLDGSTGDG